MIPDRVTLVEVGPRDGLQNEKQPVDTAHKVELVHRLQAAGLREIEVTSYVSPKWVPQMADNAQVMAAIQRRPGVRYSVLVPNMLGLQAALAGGPAGHGKDSDHVSPKTWPDEVVVFGAATQAFSQRNINCSIEESIERFAPVVAAARAAGVKVRSAISCALGCPYQGEVSPDEVEHLVKLFKQIGVHHCGVADTIGMGTPTKEQAVMARAHKHYPDDQVSGHFHDTYGQALAN
ncbi:MAG: hydroxymethylglutaryl-CoA lyase, partial [Microbacteriaceae bacterium]|nr:hydroxymethylglutaryl-CoA lyase [Burkholderiaceae bacterium]